MCKLCVIYLAKGAATAALFPCRWLRNAPSRLCQTYFRSVGCLIGGETLGAVGIVQLLVMAQDVVKGVQQGEEQPGLAMVIPVIAGRARQVDVVDDVRRGT